MKFNSKIKEHAVSQYSRKQNLLDRQKLWSLGNQQKSLYQIVFEQFNLKKDKTFLDLGAGIGKLWLETLHLFSEDFHVVLSDFSQAMLYEAKQNLKQNEDVFGSLNFIQNDAQFIPFKHLTFDLVIAGHILYHVPDINQALKEIKHILNPDGSLIATTVLKDHIEELAKLEKIAGIPHHNKKKVIFSEFGINSGKKILEDYFDKVEIKEYINIVLISEENIQILVNYVKSSFDPSNMEIFERNRHDLLREINSTIQDMGYFEITGKSAILIAEGRR